MGIMDGLKSIFGKNETEEKEETVSPVDYCEWLVKYILQIGKTEMVLDTSKPLPGTTETNPDRMPPSIPEPTAAINRLKYLSGLNPVFLAQPDGGQFERNRPNHKILVKTQFEDAEDHSICQLSLTIRVS